LSYTLGQAAKATGKSKTTISKAIHSGKISAEKQENGSYQIDPSELHRVYPVTSPSGPLDTPLETPVYTQRMFELEVLLKASEQRQADLVQRITEIEEDRDQWRVQANRLLSHREESREGIWAKLVKRFGLS
jgi:hypothetical protein